jgi:hypothetical protein
MKKIKAFESEDKELWEGLFWLVIRGMKLRNVLPRLMGILVLPLGWLHGKHAVQRGNLGTNSEFRLYLKFIWVNI